MVVRHMFRIRPLQLTQWRIVGHKEGEGFHLRKRKTALTSRAVSSIQGTPFGSSYQNAGKLHKQSGKKRAQL